MTPDEDPVRFVPDLTGPHGRAWRMDLNAARATRRLPVSSAAVASWIVEAPWAHPFWHSYWLSLVHLRPHPGLTLPIILVPGATHELSLLAIDPSAPRDPMIACEGVRYLEPGNFVAQLTLPTDAAAASRLETIVAMIVTGNLNPDTDGRRQWIALFGDACVRPEHR